jgi:DNA-binding beta-propeller fold protein YncE
LSANDGKAVLVDGVNTVPANPPPDSVTVIDLSASPPKAIAEIPVPASVVGPPSSVAIARAESFALVAAATKLDPNDPKKLVPDDTLTVIDLKASPPKVLAQLQAGKGAAGVSINRAGTLALVANRAEGTVSVFSIAGNALTPVGKVALGEEKSGPCHVAFSPDGKTALVTRDGDHKISVLSVDGNKVEYTKRDVSAGLRPYGLGIHPNGKVAVVANIGVGSGDADTASLIDIESKPPRVVHP